MCLFGLVYTQEFRYQYSDNIVISLLPYGSCRHIHYHHFHCCCCCGDVLQYAILKLVIDILVVLKCVCLLCLLVVVAVVCMYR